MAEYKEKIYKVTFVKYVYATDEEDARRAATSDQIDDDDIDEVVEIDAKAHGITY